MLIELDAEGRCTGAWSGDLALQGLFAEGCPPGPGDTLQGCLAAPLAPVATRCVGEFVRRGSSGAAPASEVVAHGPAEAGVFLELRVMARWTGGADAPAGFTLAIRDASAGVAGRRMLDRLARVAQRTSNLVVVTDARRRIEWVNDAFTQATGYTLEEVRGRNPGQLLQFEGTDPATVTLIRRALDARRPVHAEILNRSKAGREYWLALDIQPLEDGQGRLEGFVAVQSDVTENRRRTRRLTQLAQEAEQAQAALTAAVGALPDGFALFDADERLLLCNARYRELHPEAMAVLKPGVSLETLLGTEVAQGAYRSPQGLDAGWVAKALDTIRSGQTWSVDLELADGRWVRSLKRRAPRVGLIALRSDISDLKRAERLAAAQRLAAERQRLQDLMILERVEHAARLERALVETKRLQERDRQMREASEMLVQALRSLSAAEDPTEGPRHLLGQLAQALGTRCAALLAPGTDEEPLCLERPGWWRDIAAQAGLVDYLARRPQRLVADVAAVSVLQPLAQTWPPGPLRWLVSARVGPAHAVQLLVVAGEAAGALEARQGQMFERFVPLLGEALRRRDDALRARRLELDLQQARKMESLGTLAGGIAHEINTPMQYISDNLHFLKDAFDTLVTALGRTHDGAGGSQPEEPDLAYVLSEIPPALAQSLAGSRRVAEIVEAVRTFAYPELTQNEPVHLRGVLEHSLVITRSVWKHDVQVHLEADAAVPSLRGSPGPLSQVFVNLITNACDAARMVIGGAQGTGGRVRIALHAGPGEVVVHVDDNGPGVPPALRDRIFDPFFTTKRVGEGTGQGLGISRSIVERHGGRLVLEDGPLGGARFTVRLPL